MMQSGTAAHNAMYRAKFSSPQSTQSQHKIGAAGAGTVSITYTPEPTDKSTKIVFIQVMRELLDGKPAKPSESDPGFSYQDADTTSDFYHVDYIKGEKDLFYNGDDAQDIGTQGNATSKPKTNATMNDTPHYADVNFPAGKSKINYEFRTAAFSAAGDDAGKYYEYQDWTYEKEKGKAEKTGIGGTGGDPGGKFKDAVSLWNSNHGGHPILGAILGGIAGAATGAAIGSIFGGAGAVVGGIVGGLAGAGLGALIGGR